MDPQDKVREALVAIVDHDTGPTGTIRDYFGRSSDFICPSNALSFDKALPQLTYLLYAWTETGASGETWSGYVRISCFADQGDAQRTVDMALRRVQGLMNWTNFFDKGVDAAPSLFRRPGPHGDLDREGTRGLVRGDLEFEMTYQTN